MAFDISGFELTDLRDIDAEGVQQLLSRLTAQLQELNPELDLKRGVFHDTVLYYHAVLEAAIRDNLERYQSARSLQQIENNPSLADTAVVNEVLSNWGVVRREGTKALGAVVIELSTAQSITVPVGFTFQAKGREYVSTASFTSRVSESQVASETDRLLQQLSNGNWAFTVEVEAAEIGSDYKLNAGELITPVRSLVNYVTSYAASSFEDGLNTETNDELLTQLQNGISAKALANRASMRALIASRPEFASVTNQSIVGYGDPEMLRDQHTIFPISYGGRVDWYIRGQEQLERSRLDVSAKLLSVTGNTSTWQFSLDKNTYPGFYEVTKIRRADDTVLNSGFEIIEDSRSNDLTGDAFIPDIADVAEGAYSPFQTTVIKFVDTVSDVTTLTVGQTAEYACEVVGVPFVGEIQAFVSSRDIRSYAADVLVKAPVPCFVDVTLTINKAAGEPTPEINGIKTAIINEINNVGFIGRLDGSKIIDRVHGFIANASSVTELDLFGRIRRPDGSVQYLRSSDSLVIPDQPDKMVSAKTVQFFAESANISVNVKTSIPTAN